MHRSIESIEFRVGKSHTAVTETLDLLDRLKRQGF
jgi:hypothetical protein